MLHAVFHFTLLLDVQEADESEEEKGKLKGHKKASEYMYKCVFFYTCANA